MLTEYKIREINQEQAILIYQNWLLKHFPKDEVRPLQSLLQLWDRGDYQVFAMYQKEQLAAYAFIAKTADCDMVLLDYFAVREEYRSKKVGSLFFKELGNLLTQTKGILIETESVDAALTEDEMQIRERRDAFYTRGGARKTEVVTKVFGVTYSIWNYPVTEAAGDEDCREGIEKLYRNMLPNDWYDKFVEIKEKHGE